MATINIKIEQIKNLPNVWFENGAMYIATQSGRKRIEIHNESKKNNNQKMEWHECR